MPDLTPLEAAEKLDKLAMSPWSIVWSQKEEGICVADLIRISASYLRKIAAGKLIELLDIPLNKTLYWLWGDEIMPVRYKGINGGFVGKEKKFHVTYRMTTKKERSFPYTWHRKRGINTIPAGDVGRTVFFTREAAENALKHIATEQGK